MRKRKKSKKSRNQEPIEKTETRPSFIRYLLNSIVNRKFALVLSFFFAICLIYSLNFNHTNLVYTVKDIELGYKIIGILPHDPNAFTQGFFHFDGYLYESTGNYGESSLRKIDAQTGTIVKQVNFDKLTGVKRHYFIEGMTQLSNGNILLLTYKRSTGFILSLDFEILTTFDFQTDTGEGWGVTLLENSDKIYLTDGSSKLYVINESDLSPLDSIRVFDSTKTFSPERINIQRLNELEEYKGKILSNIWYTPYIALVNLNGEVEKYYNFSHEYLPFDRVKGEDSMNGIAYDSNKDVLYVTGKYWRYLVKVKLL